MKTTPGLGAAVLFLLALIGAILCGYVFPAALGSGTIKPWMFNGMWALGAVALVSAPFGWRGYLNWRIRRSR